MVQAISRVSSILSREPPYKIFDVATGVDEDLGHSTVLNVYVDDQGIIVGEEDDIGVCIGEGD